MAPNYERFPMLGVIDYSVYQCLRPVADNAMAGVVNQSDITVGYFLTIHSGGFRCYEVVLLSEYGKGGTMDVSQTAFGLDVMNANP